MAYMVMANKAMAYIIMAHIVLAYVVMAHVGIVSCRPWLYVVIAYA